MPRKVWDTEQDWLDAYEIRIRDHTHPLNGQKIGYGRTWAQRVEGPLDDNLTRFDTRVVKLTTLFAIGAADRILIGGCGFGFLIDAFHDAGFPNTWGIDNSGHIATNRPTESRGSTLFVQDDFSGIGRVRNQLRTLTGDDIFNWVISEGLVESYEDSELAFFRDTAETLLDPAESKLNIINLVYAVIDPTSPERSLDSVYNQKTIAEWKALEPLHSWVNLLNWEVG